MHISLKHLNYSLFFITDNAVVLAYEDKMKQLCVFMKNIKGIVFFGLVLSLVQKINVLLHTKYRHLYIREVEFLALCRMSVSVD